jgi:tetratricopeptide (TPR) repeat protein
VRDTCGSVLFIVFIVAIAFVAVLPAQTALPPQSMSRHEAKFDATRKQANELFLAGKTLESLPLYEELCRQDQTSAVFAERHAAGLFARQETMPDGEARKAVQAQAFAEIARAQTLGDNSPYLQTLLTIFRKLSSLPNSVPLTVGYTYKGTPEAQAKMKDAEVAFASHDLQKALQFYQSAAETDATWYSPRLYAGDMYFRMKDWTNAGIWFQKAIDIDPDRETAYRYWGDASLGAGDVAKAKRQYAQAIVAEPYNGPGWIALQHWVAVTKTPVTHLQITRPDFTAPNGQLQVDTALSQETGDGHASWLVYQNARVSHGARSLTQKAEPGQSDVSGQMNPPSYRHSLAEETECLTAMLASVQQKIKDGTVTSETLEPSLKALLQLQNDGMLESWILLNSYDAGIRYDYPAYRQQHRDLLIAYVDRYNQAAGGDKPEQQPLTPVGAKPDYSKEPFVIEQLRVRLRFENDGTGRIEHVARVRVQTEAALQRWGQLRFGYNSSSERLEIAYVRVTKQDGSVVTAGADAVQELNDPIQRNAPIYTDYREKHVTVPGLRPGDVLEYETVTVIHTAFAPGQFWTHYDFQKNNIVMDEQLEIDVPAARTIKLKTKPGLEPKITEENNRRIYRWTSSYLVREDQDKANDERKKRRKYKPEDEVPAVQLSSFASWEEVGRWYAGLEKGRRVPSTAVRAKANELTKGLPNDIDKIEALYDYTARNFRYVSLSLGVGRYQPHSADEVLHNQYGDCKDKHTLLASLLEAEGIHASSVMINSVRALDPDVPSPSQFNHVITMVPVGNEQVWIDTTTEVAPFRLLAFQLRKKQALVIPADGTPPHLEQTPADSPIPDTETIRIDGTVDDAGKLDARIAYEIRGDFELRLRQAFRHVPSAQLQQVMESVSSTAGLGKDISEPKTSDPDATREPFTFSYRVSKVNYLDASKKKLDLKLPLPVLALATADSDDADSSDPIKLGPPNTHDYHLRLELPSKYSARAPLPISQKRDYGDYEAVYKLEGNVFSAERKLVVGVSELPASRVQDYMAFRHVVVADLEQQLSLETTMAEKMDSSADLKPNELVKRGEEERRNGNYDLSIDLLKRAVEADPKSKLGWNELGLAYFDSKQNELAISSFQKQIEVNPYHQRSYNNLGRVYLEQRAYEEAIKWFDKQLEINPLDKYAHSNLGILYLEQHKYTEAVPELEQGASLTPDNAESQVRLGEAYLNLDQDEKAMAAFDRAVKISARPAVWNNIAYQLTLKRKHPDVARRYAESAVTTTAASLRNLSLDQLKPRDIGPTSLLARCWDTLGWVEFADGNLDKAQKYVLAAWQLGQGSQAADHLGQIYEKRGEKERALHFYALATNARRPEPEIRNRLAALAGGNDKVDATVEKSRDELDALRTIRVRNTPQGEGKAEFFLLLTPGQGSEMSVDEVKFAGGDERLKSFTLALHTAKYGQTVPDETSVKVLRRGTLSCTTAAADCTFLLALPSDLHSVD